MRYLFGKIVTWLHASVGFYTAIIILVFLFIRPSLQGCSLLSILIESLLSLPPLLIPFQKADIFAFNSVNTLCSDTLHFYLHHLELEVV